ncbi:SPRY domain-containing protein [Variovorax sp. tm]|uniref:SPRY domain-containing protein n=1 Tax=Variovorax atrisoli TaxID=3394203 RepID=UPI003A806C6C
MAAHRYWRATGMEAYGFAGLELTEFQLLAGTVRVDGPATLTSNIVPSAGTLAGLKDDDTATGATWSATALRSLILNWDFGAGVEADVTDIRLGSGSDPTKFLLIALLQFSDDGVSWTDLQLFNAVSWPGVRSRTVSFDPTGRWSLYDHGAQITISDDQYTMTGNAPVSARALVSKSSGIQQFEVVMTSLAPSSDFAIGVGTAAANVNGYVGSGAGSFAYNRNGNKYLAGVPSSYGALFTTGDVIGVVVNFSTGALTFYKNGVSQGVASAAGMLGLTLFPMAGQTSGGTSFNTATLRGRGFLFPVAGASEWTGLPLITRSAGVARPSSLATVRVPSAMSIGLPYGQTKLQQLHRGRQDYGTGVIGQGIGRVRGFTLDYVNPLNKPYRCRVRLVRESDGLQLREVWSGADGSYDFQFVDELQSYTVIAYYLAHGRRAVVTDGLTLANGKVELMP